MKKIIVGILLLIPMGVFAWHEDNVRVTNRTMNQDQYETAMGRTLYEMNKNYDDAILINSAPINTKNSNIGPWSSLKPGESYVNTQTMLPDEKGVTADGLTGEARLGTQSVNLYQGKDATNTMTGGTSSESYGSSGLGTTYEFKR